MAISLLAYPGTFSGQLYFWKSYFFALRHSSYFFGAAISLEQMLFFFQKNQFFIAVVFSKQLLLQGETYTEQPLLENRKFFRAVRPFWCRNFSKYIYLQKSYFLEAGSSAHHQLFQKSHILEKATFSEKHYSALPTFSGELPFHRGDFSKTRYLPQKLHFQKSYFLITYVFKRVTISLFLSYTSFPLPHFLFISQQLSELSTSYVQLKCGSSFLCIYYCSNLRQRQSLIN